MCNISEVTVKNEQILLYVKGDLQLEAVAALVTAFGNKLFVSAGARPCMILKVDRKFKENVLLTVKKLLEEYKKYLQ